MKLIEIVGKNYFGHFDHIRYASRALVIKDDNILLSYEKNNDIWMLPGGGAEDDETASDTVIREVKEETGYLINPSDIVLELHEYYEDFKYVTYYFLGEIISIGNKNLSESEIESGLEPEWIKISEALDIFSKHNDYKGDEMKRGLYLREYKALKELLSRN